MREFQFTRPQGARLLRAFGGMTQPSFNSRARKGRDPVAVGVSCCTPCFNSRARKGRDTSSSLMSSVYLLFQFTRPQGARPPITSFQLRRSCFNSRARKGRDLKRVPLGLTAMFQFTRPQGARRATRRSFRRKAVRFNSRARKGRDRNFTTKGRDT